MQTDVEAEISLNRASTFCDGLDHPECVAVHPDGSVWAGGEAGQIYRISADGAHVDKVADTGGFILGIAFSPEVRWLAICDMQKQCVWRLDLQTQTLHVFAEGVDGHDFCTPNYAAFAGDGTLYVTDSGSDTAVNGHILRFGAAHDGRGEVWNEKPFHFANGLALSPDERALYVVCSFLPGVERVEITPEGGPGRRDVIAEMAKTVPDGVACDAEGNVYVSCYVPPRIYRISPDGHLSVLLDDWTGHVLANPTNIAFGGPNFSRLFIANLGRWHITQVESGLQGASLASHK